MININKFIGIVLLVLFALDPGAAFKMVPDTVAEEALAAAQEPTTDDTTRDEDLAEASGCTWTYTDPATDKSSCYILVAFFFDTFLDCSLYSCRSYSLLEMKATCFPIHFTKNE